MKNITIATLILALVAPSFSCAESAWSEGTRQLVMGGHPAGGLRGGRGRRFGTHKPGRGFHRGNRTHRSYYYHPRYFYWNYHELRRFYRHENRSHYPNQRGSDYRDWFHFPSR